MRLFGWWRSSKSNEPLEVLNVWQIADIFEEAGKSEQWKPEFYTRVGHSEWDLESVPTEYRRLLSQGEEALVQMSGGRDRDTASSPSYREQLLQIAAKLRTIPRVKD